MGKVSRQEVNNQESPGCERTKASRPEGIRGENREKEGG
jgi:hypothetical protein